MSGLKIKSVVAEKPGIGSVASALSLSKGASDRTAKVQ
jgi:hypothetical protein